jgi:hypothetical protein
MTKKKMTAFIYRIDCACGCEKFYVGSTINPVKARFYQHKYAAKRNSRLKLHNHMREVGIENFSIHLLKKLTYSVNKPNFREKVEGEYVSSLDTVKNGCNNCQPGFNYMYENQNRKKLIKCGDCHWGGDFIGFDSLAEFRVHLRSKRHKERGHNEIDQKYRIELFS